MSIPKNESIQLRAAVQHAVVTICGQLEEERGGSSISSMTGPAIEAVAELTFLWATTSLAQDLDAFSTHAGRKSIIHVDDVKLMARKNPDILRKLEEFCEKNNRAKIGKSTAPTTIAATAKNNNNNSTTKRARKNSGTGVLRESMGSSRRASNASAFDLPSSDDDDDDDLDLNSSTAEKDFGPSKPSSKNSAFRKRARPVGRLTIKDSDDSSTNIDDSDIENQKKKKNLPNKNSAVESDSSDDSNLENRKSQTEPPKKKSTTTIDSSTDNDSDVENDAKKKKKKKLEVKNPIELDDSSTSSEDSLRPADKKKKDSQLLKVLAGSLSFSDDEESD